MGQDGRRRCSPLPTCWCSFESYQLLIVTRLAPSDDRCLVASLTALLDGSSRRC